MTSCHSLLPPFREFWYNLNMVPKRLQAVLWNVSTDKLEVQGDKEYIIHQVLAYGRWEDVKWLFDTYGMKQVKEVFISHSEKDYTPAGFKFVSKILLGIEENLDFGKYDRFAPRVIG